MDLKKELRTMVKYILPKEEHDKDVIENYVDTLALINEEYVKQLRIGGVIERYSGENLMKLQKHFVSLYGSDEMAQEKANSFAVGFGKACELIIKDLNAL